MNMKQLIALLLSLVLLLGLTACGSNAADSGTTAGAGTVDVDPANVDEAFLEGPEIEIQVGFSASDETLMGKKTYVLAERVHAASGGKITITVYPNGQLGGDSELFESVAAGNITAMTSTPSAQVNYIPELAILDIGGLYTDLDTCNAVLSGDFFDQLSTYYEDNGLKLLSMDATNFRLMTSNTPVYTYSDFSGIKIRTQENKYHTTYWSALGTNPTPLAFGELYIGLQQGLVEAQENPIETMQASKLQEVQDYVIITNHIPFLSTMTMNLEFWESLPLAYQDVLNKYIREVYDELVAESVDNDLRVLADLEADGLEVIYLDDATLKQMQAGTEACIEEMKKNIDPALVDSYVGLARAAAE